MSSRRSRSGGTPKLHDVEPVVQVAAEPAGGDLGAQVAVGRGDARARRRGGARPTPTRWTSPVSSTRSSLACTVERQLADLVEEQRAAVGDLEQPGLGVGRAGERAAHVPEQLAFEQRLDDGRAVDDDEPLAAARPGAMERARDQLLAGCRSRR